MSASCVIRFSGAKQYSTHPGHAGLRRRARWLKMLGDDAHASHWPGLPTSVRSRMLGFRDYVLWHGEDDAHTYSALHSSRAGQSGPASVLYLCASSHAEAWLESSSGVWALTLTGTQDPAGTSVDREWVIRLDGNEVLALMSERAICVRTC